MKVENKTTIPNLTNWQWGALVTVRVLIGWHLLYEGVVKFFIPDWTSRPFLEQSTGMLSGFFISIAESPFWTPVVDVLNQWGLLLIGIALIAGLFTRIGAVSGAIMLLFYYLAHPPLFDQSAALLTAGHTLIVDQLLVESAALFAVSLFPTGKVIGVDYLIMRMKKEDNR